MKCTAEKQPTGIKRDYSKTWSQISEHGKEKTRGIQGNI